jgi:hypothetical protein
VISELFRSAGLLINTRRSAPSSVWWYVDGKKGYAQIFAAAREANPLILQMV